jgi:hypothetical protein
MEEYLLKVGALMANEVASWLMVSEAPEYVRLATMAPLSAYGYPAGTEGAILRIDERGLIVGVEDREDVPRDFIPWQNVSYMTDGTLLAKEQAT